LILLFTLILHFILKLMILDAVFYSFIPFLITLAFSNLTLIKLIKMSTIGKLAVNNDSRFTNNTANRNQIMSLEKKKNSKIAFIFSEKKNKKAKNSNTVVYKNSKIEFADGNPNSLQNSNSIQRTECNKNSQTEHDQIYSIRNEKLIKLISPLIKKKKTSGFKTTLMLMTLPISYLISTFPVFIIILLQFINNVIRDQAENDYETEFSISKLCMYLNNSFNILCFMLFGESVRNDIRKSLSRKKSLYRKKSLFTK
jgi:hypothetical protein